MKFGKKLKRQLTAQWAASYIDYKGLKKLVKHYCSDEALSEADRKHALMVRVSMEAAKVNSFYLTKLGSLEQTVAAVLAALRQMYGSRRAAGQQTQADKVFGDSDPADAVAVEPSREALWDMLSDETAFAGGSAEQAHVDPSSDPLKCIDELRASIDQLRSFASLNYLGFVKILKKFDKHSKADQGIQMPVLDKVIRTQSFFKSLRLGRLLARLDCVRLLLNGESLTLEEPVDALMCPVCLDNVRQPAILGCGHRFCNGCLEEHGEAGGTNCPVCRRHDAAKHYEVDEVLNCFVTALWPNRPDPVARTKQANPADQTVAMDADSVAKDAQPVKAATQDPQGVTQLSDIQQLLNHAKPGALFVLDIDETLITNEYAPCLLLSPSGVAAFNTCLANSAQRLDVEARRAVRGIYQEALRAFRPVQRCTAQVVKQLQDQGCSVFGLTARSAHHCGSTREALLNADIDLAKTAPLLDLTGLDYELGIIYCGTKPKGPILKKFLDAWLNPLHAELQRTGRVARLAQRLPSEVIFVDDRRVNVESVALAMGVMEGTTFCQASEGKVGTEMGVPCTAYHYTVATYQQVQDSLGVDYHAASERAYWHATKKVQLCLGQEILRLQLQRLFFKRQMMDDAMAIEALRSGLRE